MNIRFINRYTGEIQIENPPAERLIKFLYDNPFGRATLLKLVKRKFISQIYGRKMDKPSSINKIQKFVDKLGIDISESIKSISEFSTFNEFFYRKLKPNVRPIGDGFVSPGDGRLLAFENVSDVSKFYIKGSEFTLDEFLDNKELAEKNKNSSLIILRLAPNDYHRYHFPYNGKVSETTKIKGKYLSVSPYALVKNFTKVFCGNKREFCIISTKDKGDIIVSPVGATMVGSIIETFKPNSDIKKGDEMGYFSFGGSTIVMLVDKDKIKIDKDILRNTKNNMETYVKMGDSIGK